MPLLEARSCTDLLLAVPRAFSVFRLSATGRTRHGPIMVLTDY